MRNRGGRRHAFYGLPAAFFLIFAICLAVSGCSSSRYQEISLEEISGSSGAEEETMLSLTMGEDGNLEVSDSEPETSEGVLEETEQETYEDVDEVVVVTADVLNVRESANEEAKIYAQLKAGSTLRRTGISGEWSRVLYEGQTAYVSTAMVEVYEEPETETAESAEAAAVGEEISALEESGEPAAAAAARTVGEEPAVPFNGHVIAIDAGHQAKANAEKEPIGPGSETMKAKMPEGSTGAESGVRECELTLEVAKKLKSALEEKGYRVVMIRESNDVNLSSAERSLIANESGAEALIRLHANSMENSGVYGALAMCMTDQNPYNAELHGKSYSLSKKLVDNICGQTGTKNRGVQEVDNSSDINWCEIPVSVVEMGFLSNPDEDRMLQDEAYQDKIVAGISAAVDSYFAEGN